MIRSKRRAARHRLAKRLFELRLRRDWTQDDLAEATGLHRTYVSLIERERCNVGIDTLESIAKGLGVDLADLFRS